MGASSGDRGGGGGFDLPPTKVGRGRDAGGFTRPQGSSADCQQPHALRVTRVQYGRGRRARNCSLCTVCIDSLGFRFTVDLLVVLSRAVRPAVNPRPQTETDNFDLRRTPPPIRRCPARSAAGGPPAAPAAAAAVLHPTLNAKAHGPESTLWVHGRGGCPVTRF